MARTSPTAATSAPNDTRAARSDRTLRPTRTWLASDRAPSCRREDGRDGRGRTMVRGSGSGRTTGRAATTSATCRGASCQRSTCGRGRCGAVGGRQAHPRLPRRGIRAAKAPSARSATCTSPPRPHQTRGGRDTVMGGTLVGTLLVVGGLWLAYVAGHAILAAISAACGPAGPRARTADARVRAGRARRVPWSSGTNRLARDGRRGPEHAGMAAATDSRGSCPATIVDCRATVTLGRRPPRADASWRAVRHRRRRSRPRSCVRTERRSTCADPRRRARPPLARPRRRSGLRRPCLRRGRSASRATIARDAGLRGHHRGAAAGRGSPRCPVSAA